MSVNPGNPSDDPFADLLSGKQVDSGNAAFNNNLAAIKKAQDDYAAQQQAADTAANARANKDAPLWAQGLQLIGAAMKYTSGNTYIRKYVPGVATAEDVIPGVKTLADVASNPLTYLTVGAATPEEAGLEVALDTGLPMLGKVGLRASAPMLERGIGGAIGGAIGQQAGVEYQKTGLPGGSLAPALGGLIGGVKGYGAANSVLEGGLGNLPGVGNLLPEDLKSVGQNAGIASAAAEKAAAAATAQAQTTGELTPGITLYTRGDGEFTTVKPKAIQDTSQLTPQDFADPVKTLEDAAIHPQPEGYVYATVNAENAKLISDTTVLDKQGAVFSPTLSGVTLDPADTAIVRVPEARTKIDPKTGQAVATRNINTADVHVLTADGSWKPLGGSLSDATKGEWTPVPVTSPEEAAKYTFDGKTWHYDQTPEEIAAAKATQTGQSRNASNVLTPQEGTPPVPEPEPVPGQQPMPLAGDMAATREPLAPTPENSAASTTEPKPEEQGYQPKLLGTDKFAPPQVTPPAPGEVNPTAFHQEVVSSSVQNGGGTFDVANGEPIIPKAFAEPGATGNISTKTSVGVMPERSVIIPQDKFTPEAVQAWERANADVLNDGVHHMGTWVHDGDVHLDVVELTTPKKAVALGLENTQHSVFNMRTGADIPVPGVDDAAVQAKFAEARARGDALVGTPATPAGPQAMTLTHYGPTAHPVIDPNFQGTGVPSEELARNGVNPNADARYASYYEEGQQPEKFFTDKTGVPNPSLAKHTVTGNFNILDLTSPEGRDFIAKANIPAGPVGHELDNALQQAGYDGYKNGSMGTVRMFGQRPVSAINDIPVEKNITTENSTMHIAPDGSAVDEAFAGKETPTPTPEPAPQSRVQRTELFPTDKGPMTPEPVPGEARQVMKRGQLVTKGASPVAPQQLGAPQLGAATPEEINTFTDRPVTDPRAQAAGKQLLDELNGPGGVNPAGRPNYMASSISPEDAAAKGLVVTRDLSNGKSFYQPDGTFVQADWTSPHAPVSTSGPMAPSRANFEHNDLALLLGGKAGDEVTLFDKGFVRIAKGLSGQRVTLQAGSRDDLEMAVSQMLRHGEDPNTPVAWDAGNDHGRGILKDLAPVEDMNPAGRAATHGMLYGTGAKNEAGNFLPDTVKQLYSDGKILNGSVGAKSVQDVLGKMLAADFLLHGSVDDASMTAFEQKAMEQFGIDLKAPATGTGVQAGQGTTLGDYVQNRANYYVNNMLSKPRYNGDLANMQRLTGLLLSADPVSGQWYENTLPAVYELFGQEDGNTFLKFLATTSQQKTPRDNIQIALDAFADYKLGYFKDPNYIPFGMPEPQAQRLRYVAQGGEATGLKINAFHGGLTLDDYNAPVDRWMFRIFGFDDAKVASSANVHEIIAQQMRSMADQLGMTPREVQARLWVAARNESMGANVVNEPYEELMLGSGKYTSEGQLQPDLTDNKGLPTAKQTLQHILDMRDKGIIDLPKDTTAAQQEAQRLVEETAAIRENKVAVSMVQATALAKDAGVPVLPGEDAATILDKVFAQQGGTPKGPVFTPADAARDEEGQTAKQMSFAGMAQHPEDVMDYNPTAMSARSNELDTWHAAGAIDHPTMPEDLQNVRDNFRQRVDSMHPNEVAQRFNSDARTADWQKGILQEQRPEAVTGDVAQEMRARPEGSPAQATTVGAGASPQPDMATLKDDLRKAGVPEDKVDEIAQRASEAATPPVSTDTGQAMRASSRAAALSPSPFGDSAYVRSRGADPNTLTVNDRPVVSAVANTVAGTADPELNAGARMIQSANQAIEKTIATSSWAPTVDKAFSDAVDLGVNILDRGKYALQGAGPKSGGLYYRPGEIGFYNDVQAPSSLAKQGYGDVGTLARADTTIHLNPVDMFQNAQNEARLQGISLPRALAQDTVETGLHEVAHDLAFHGVGEQNFLDVLNQMKADGAAEVAAHTNALEATFQKMADDGTLIKWENDNGRIGRLNSDANAAARGGGAGSQWTDSLHDDQLPLAARGNGAVGQNAVRNAEGVPPAAQPASGGNQGVPSGAPSGGGRPGGGVPSAGGDAEARLTAASGLPDRSAPVEPNPGITGERPVASRLQRTDLNGNGVNPAGRPAAPAAESPGAPGQPPVVRITSPEPQLLQRAGAPEKTAVFEEPLPEGRILEAPRSLTDIQDSLLNDNKMRQIGNAVADRNPIAKAAIDAIAGKTATAVTPFEKDIAAYAVKGDVDASRAVMAMAEIRQGPSPFDTLAGDLTHATDWRGNDVIVPKGDLYSHPDNFILNDAQKGYVARIHQVLDEAVADARAAGVDIKDLASTSGDNGHWVPRWVQGADGVSLERPYGKTAFGASQPFDKARSFPTQAQGMQSGIVYHNTDDAIQAAVSALLQKTRDAELINNVKGMGATPSELAGPAARAPLDAQVIKLTDARNQLNAANKAVADLKVGNATIQAGRQTLSPADIRNIVSTHPDVTGAQSALADATKVRDDLQTRWNSASTPAAQERIGAQLDVAKNKVAVAQNDLKEANSNIRQQVTSSDTEQVTGAKTKSANSLADAIAQQKAAQANYDSIYAGTTQAKRDLSSILKSKANTFREPGTAFGMSSDIIPVRTTTIPALGNRIFPSETADQLEAALSPKTSKALSNLAKVNDFSRMMVTATDFAAPFLQGLPILARDPGAWAKGMVAHFQTYFDPEHLQAIYAANREFANASGFNDYVGGLNANEFYNNAIGGKTIIGHAAESPIPLLRVPAQALGRFRIAFDAFNDVAKLETWRGLYQSAEGDPKKLEELGTFVRNLSGSTSMARAGATVGQRQVESLVMFAPRFTRSAFALGAQAMQGGIGGANARRSLASLVLGAMAAYAAVKTGLHAAGMGDPLSAKDFDPSQGGRFMSVKVGDNYIGLGGSMRGAIQMLGSAAVAGATNPSELISTDSATNPFLKFARSRSAPGVSQVWNLISGTDPIGHQYTGTQDWLSKLPDSLMPFGVSALVGASGSPQARVGIYAAQTLGLRTFPETLNENLSKTLKDDISKIPTNVVGFSATDRADITSWANLTKFQKVAILQRYPEIRQQLDPKEAQYWTGYKQVEADTLQAKRSLGQQLLDAQAKTAQGIPLSPGDMTAAAYRKALSDITTKQYAAEAALNGANAITGQGGNYASTGGPTTHRQQVMTDYYNNVVSADYVDPNTGQLDFAAKDAAEAQYLATIPAADQAIVAQEQGAEYDIVARELKAAKMALAPYWSLGDSIAKSMGFDDAQALTMQGSAAQLKAYNAKKLKAETAYKKANPTANTLLIDWGYAKTPPTKGLSIGPVNRTPLY